MKVRKAIIPAAGLGTRFLPATKATPKEMLPIVDKPAIQYIVEEAVEAGITSIIIITGRGKRAIEDHFDASIELEHELARKGNTEQLDMVRAIASMADVYYIRQGEPKGLGHAIGRAREFIADEPFAVMLGDDVVAGEKPAIGQLIDVYDKTGVSVLGVQNVGAKNAHKYGIVSPGGSYMGFTEVAGLVEKPPMGTEPSDLAILGRYVLTPQIMQILEHTAPGKGGEIQLTDAMITLLERERILTCEFVGRRYDIGDKLGFLQATVETALRRDDLKAEFAAYLKGIEGTI